MSRTLSYQNNEVLYGYGAKQIWLWGVVAGQVRVHVALSGRDLVLGHIHQPGSWLGESELLLGTPGLVEMRASGNVEVVRIEYLRFRELASKHIDLWEALARLASMNQVLAMSAANDLVLRTGKERLAAALLRLSGHRADFQATTTSPGIPASQQEIANLANVSLSNATDQLGRFAKRGLISQSYGRINVLDAVGLQAFLQV